MDGKDYFGPGGQGCSNIVLALPVPRFISVVMPVLNALQQFLAMYREVVA